MELIQLFIKYITHEKRYSENTIKAYYTDICSLRSFIDSSYKIQLQKATSEHLRYWILKLANDNISPRSYKRKLSSLKTFYKYLLREGLIENDPSEAIIVPRHRNPIPDFFNSKETINLFEHVLFSNDYIGTRDKLILDIFYHTGIRLSELINLRLSDIDFGRQQISVIGKRNKQRNIPVIKKLLTEISNYIELRNEEFNIAPDLLFLTKKGAPLYPRLVQRLVDKYMQQATTSEKRHPHKLRHTFATHMLNNGANLNAVKELLGHASLSATEVYTHNTYEKLKSIYKQAHPRA